MLALGLLCQLQPAQALGSEASSQARVGTSTGWLEGTQRAIADGEYRVSRNGIGLQALNRSHDMRTYFDADGIRLQNREASEDTALVGLSLAGFGRVGRLSTVEEGEVSHHGARVENRRPGITEWYENSPLGLEQGFDLDARPEGEGALVLELRVRGARASLDDRSIVFTAESGRRLRYGKLVAWDASGNELASRFEVSQPHLLRLVVEDAGATYPIVIDPLITAIPDATLESNHDWSGTFDSAMFGSSVADAGDVNGDGFSDIVIGAYGWDIPGGLFDEGAAFVFLGGPDGIVGTDPTTANAVLLGDQAGTEFGWRVAGAGDVNGDGFDDIIVGSALYNSTIAGGTLPVRGAAFVFLGSPTGIDATGPSTAHASIFGTVQDSKLGHSVSAAGDVNNDGFGDIIVGMPRMGIPFACTQTNPPTCTIPENDYQGNGGAALIFLGSAEGITGTSIDDADSVILSYPPGQPAVSEDQVGADVAAAGDVNNDGFSDVLVGAAGYIMAFHGSAAGIVGTDPGSADAVITSTASISLGVYVAGAGDVNGDGFDDIMASDTGYPTEVTTDGHGAFMVFHGSASGVTASSPADADTFIEGNIPIESLGWRFAGVGDVEGDSFGDVAVGSLNYPGGLDREGIAYIFRGSAAGLVGSTLDDAFVQLKTGQAEAAYRSNKPGFDIAGFGDINGDGFADVLMGAGLYDAGELNEGAVFVYHGGPGSGGPVNQSPVAYAGTNQSVQDADRNGSEEITLDGSASFDPDGSIVSYEWYNGTTFLGTGASLTTAFSSTGTQSVSLVVTDDGGKTGVDALTVRVELPSSSFVLNEPFTSGLGDWVVVGDATLLNDSATFPDSPHARLGASGASMRRSIVMPTGSTGIRLSFWGKASQFGVSDELLFNVSVDGGPFTTFDTLRPQDEGLNDDAYYFYGGSVAHGPVSTTWVPATASNVVLEFESNMSTGVFVIDSIEVRALIGNASPVANAGPDQSADDAGGDGVEVFTLDGSGSADPNGSIVSYEWRDGPTLLGSTASLGATLSLGVHTIVLTVTDDGGETASDSVVIRVGAVSVCGNGMLDVGESCDDGNTNPGDCCSATCQIETAGTVCRGSAGACDVAEVCDGVLDVCPVDLLEPIATLCRGAAGICDAPESCDGASASCPVDVKLTSECRGSAGTCDVAEVCDGVLDVCPVDLLEPDGSSCDDGDICTEPDVCQAGGCEGPPSPSPPLVCEVPPAVPVLSWRAQWMVFAGLLAVGLISMAGRKKISTRR